MHLRSRRRSAIVFVSFASLTLPLLLTGALGAEPASADAVGRGKAIAEEYCAECHAIGLEGESPYPRAPVWREFVATNDIDAFARAFEEGRLVHHDGIKQMPDFIFSSEQIASLMAYIKSLRSD